MFENMKIKLLDKGFGCWYALALEESKVVGLLQVEYKSNHLKSHGTKVITSYRGKGIALAMWSEAINTFKPESVSINAVTVSGLALEKKLKQVYPEIDWMT